MLKKVVALDSVSLTERQHLKLKMRLYQFGDLDVVHLISPSVRFHRCDRCLLILLSTKSNQGVGTVRDCSIAVNLLKRVCERGSWVSSRLQEAYALQQLGQTTDTTSSSSSFTSAATGSAASQYTNGDMSAFLFLQLAEAGHEVAQMNLAHLMDTGKSSLVMASPVFSRFYAQRHYIIRKNAPSPYRKGTSQKICNADL